MVVSLIQFEHSSGLGNLFHKGYNSKITEVIQREKEFQVHYKN